MDDERSCEGHRKSQLCSSLHYVLHDTTSEFNILDYFLQYMESVSALNLVQFWLSVQSFRSLGGDEKTRGSQHVHSEVDCSKPLSVVEHAVGNIVESIHLSNCSERVKECSISSQHQTDCVLTLTRKAVGLDSTASPADIKADGSFRNESSTNLLSDATELYSQYISLNSPSPVGLPDSVRQDIEVSICPEDGLLLDTLCFDEAQQHVFDVMDKRWYPQFVRSSFMSRHQLEYISSGKLQLIDVVLGESILFHFMEYMEQEGVSSLLHFWLMAENFYNHMKSPDRVPDIDVDVADAIAIYDKFISLQALEPLNLGDTVRVEVEEGICGINGPIPNCFVCAQQSAYEVMNKNHFPKFLQSSIHLSFLNDLVNSLDESTSEPKSKNLETRSTPPNTCISTAYTDLDDAQSLWKQEKLKMRLGTVDEFGFYTSEVYPIPNFKEHRDKRKSSSWLRRRKVDEVLAVKIARNFVMEVLESTKS